MKINLFLRKTGVFLIFFFTVALSSNQASGQGRVVCGTDEMYRHDLLSHPDIQAEQQKMEAFINQLRTAQMKTNADTGQIIIVPVIFHIIHDNGPENISDQTIKGQVDRLNLDYRKLNPDTSRIRALFKPLATDARIEFRLATVDPWGRCTTGIDRMVSTQTIDATDQVKSLDWWDSRQYLNIWVVRSIEQSGLPPGTTLAGYSHFPWDATITPWADGIIVNYQFVGKAYRTLTHEIGHYFGLYHPFQDGCSSDPDLGGDHIHDTPPVAEANFGWNTAANSCHDDNPDLPDMIENYMDYADHPYMFTAEQVWRMRAFALSRAELISSANLAYTLQVCSVAGVAGFTGNDAASLKIYPNPTRYQFTIEYREPNILQGSITVTDMAGKIIYRNSEMLLGPGRPELILNREAIHASAPGMYYIRLETGNDIIRRKLIMQ